MCELVGTNIVRCDQLAWDGDSFGMNELRTVASSPDQLFFFLGWVFRPTSWLLNSCIDIVVRDSEIFECDVLVDSFLDAFQNIFSVSDILNIAIALRPVASILFLDWIIWQVSVSTVIDTSVVCSHVFPLPTV